MKLRKFIRVFCALVLTLGIFSCDKDSDTQPQFPLEKSDVIPDEHYEIYSLVINKLASSGVMVIGQQSLVAVDLKEESIACKILTESMPGFDVTLVSILNEVNKNVISFDTKFVSDKMKVSLISQKEIDDIFSGQNVNTDWGEFYNRYNGANGLTQFTRIALNKEKTQAVLEVSQNQASLAGMGSIFYLEKKKGYWTVMKVIPTWVS